MLSRGGARGDCELFMATVERAAIGFATTVSIESVSISFGFATAVGVSVGDIDLL